MKRFLKIDVEILEIVLVFSILNDWYITFPRLASVASFGTDYFLLKIIFLAKREREFTTKFAIAPNVC